MRYTARTRSIEWKQDAVTLAAVASLEKLLASDSPYIYHARLKPGMGLLSNNVLHDRSAFEDDPAHRACFTVRATTTILPRVIDRCARAGIEFQTKKAGNNVSSH